MRRNPIRYSTLSRAFGFKRRLYLAFHVRGNREYVVRCSGKPLFYAAASVGFKVS